MSLPSLKPAKCSLPGSVAWTAITEMLNCGHFSNRCPRINTWSHRWFLNVVDRGIDGIRVINSVEAFRPMAVVWTSVCDMLVQQTNASKLLFYLKNIKLM